jgi:hypothetical protein
VSPFAGTGAGAPYIGNYMDGASLTVAQFPFPNGVAVNQHSEVFVTDRSWTIRMISNNGTPLIFSSASFHSLDLELYVKKYVRKNFPILFHASMNHFFSNKEFRLQCVYSLVIAVVYTIAGTGSKGFADGDGSIATFGGYADFVGITVALSSGIVYLADCANHRVRAIQSSMNV